MISMSCIGELTWNVRLSLSKTDRPQKRGYLTEAQEQDTSVVLLSTDRLGRRCSA